MVALKSIPYGSDVSAGTYECLDCGRRIDLQSSHTLPPCPNGSDGRHQAKAWRAVRDQGVAADDPMPPSLRGLGG
jgi:hypothetical protein